MGREKSNVELMAKNVLIMGIIHFVAQTFRIIPCIFHSRAPDARGEGRMVSTDE
jgi:hypothetical protein